jgi:hypothetical protein
MEACMMTTEVEELLAQLDQPLEVMLEFFRKGVAHFTTLDNANRRAVAQHATSANTDALKGETRRDKDFDRLLDQLVAVLRGAQHKSGVEQRRCFWLACILQYQLLTQTEDGRLIQAGIEIEVAREICIKGALALTDGHDNDAH